MRPSRTIALRKERHADQEGNVYLVDSGAQYLDGTTDITRTIAVGRPTREMRAMNTRVLKGHIAIATSVFPRGTSGAHSIPSRAARSGMSEPISIMAPATASAPISPVHEGPQRISKLGGTPLEPGMILSNEPGYYREGLRHPHRKSHCRREAQDGRPRRDMLGFETITFAPIDDGADRREASDARGNRLAERLSPAGVGKAGGRGFGRRGKWLRQATKKLA